jgi:hypothetical protein
MKKYYKLLFKLDALIRWIKRRWAARKRQKNIEGKILVKGYEVGNDFLGNKIFRAKE